jgi:hypothetical protein
MNRRRLAFVLASMSVCGIALVASCSFPDVQFATSSEGGGGGGGGEGGLEGSTDSPLGEASSDAAMIEAAVRSDADTKVDAAGCKSCDCDNDTFLARVDGGCEGGPGAVYDCDDTDKFINPDQTWVGDVKWPSDYQVIYDWNCNGKVEKAYPTNLKCAYNLTTCTGGQGYKGDPGCGTSEDYFECQDKGALTGGCVAVKIDALPRKQLCK